MHRRQRHPTPHDHPRHRARRLVQAVHAAEDAGQTRLIRGVLAHAVAVSLGLAVDRLHLAKLCMPHAEARTSTTMTSLRVRGWGWAREVNEGQPLASEGALTGCV